MLSRTKIIAKSCVVHFTSLVVTAAEKKSPIIVSILTIELKITNKMVLMNTCNSLCNGSAVIFLV